MNNGVRIIGLVALLVGLVVLSPTSPVQAAGVIGTGTPGSCTEEALDLALAGGGNVSFNCGSGDHTIGLTSEKVISADTSIDGGGSITLDGQDHVRIFRAGQNVALELHSLTLTGGNPGELEDGGAILTDRSTLTITESTISGNTARLGGGLSTTGGTITLIDSTINGNTAAFGGGIYKAVGSLTVIRTAISDNYAASTGNGGAGIYNSGGPLTINASTISNNQTPGNGGALLAAGANLTITQSTISGNSAGSDGGAIRFLANTGNTVTVSNTTITANSASFAGGIRKIAGQAYFQNSIIANNSGGNCMGGGFNSLDFNLTDQGGCGLNQPNDLQNTAAGLAPLGDYGGPTQTHHPLNGSAAIDSAACVTPVDQRGVGRPQGVACDRGSVEALEPLVLSTLCVNFFTGGVSSAFTSQCAAGQWQLSLPAPFPLNICVNSFSGQVTYAGGGVCAPPRTLHVVPNDGPVLVCWSRYTGHLRAVTDVSRCVFGTEIPAFIPAQV